MLLGDKNLTAFNGFFFWFKNNRSSGDQWKGLGEVGFGTWGQTEGVQTYVGLRVRVRKSVTDIMKIKGVI